MGPCLSKSQERTKKTEVNIWLNDNGLGEYSEKFKEKGWDEISLLLEMSDVQVEMCIQKPGHVVKFKKALESLSRSMRGYKPRGQEHSHNEEPRPESSGLESSFDETSYAKMKESRRFRPDESESGDGTPVNSLTYKSEPQTVAKYLRADTEKDDGATVNYAGEILPKSADKYTVQPRDRDSPPWDSDSGEETPANTLLQYNSEPKSAFKETTADSFLDQENRYPSYLSELTTASKYTTADESLSDDGSLVAHTSKTTSGDLTGTDGNRMGNKVRKARLNSDRSETSSCSSISRERSYSDSSFEDTPAYNHIRDESDMIVKWYEKKDHLYVETETCKELKCILDEIHWATLLGKSGDGKSATVAHLMLHYRDKGFEPMYISTAVQWKTFINKRKDNATKHVVVIDDMFGGCIVDKHKSDQWVAMFDEMVKTIKASAGTLIVVCTSRRYVFSDVEADLENFKFFDEYYIVDMTTEAYQLSEDEKTEIFDKYMTEYDVPDSDRLDVRNVDPTHGFAHCVEMYCANEALRKKRGASFFDDPINCVKEEILGFKDTDTVKYVVLLLVLLKKNHLNKNFFESIKVHATQDDRKIFKGNYIDLEDDLQTLLPDVYDALDELGNSYLAHGPDGTCCFSHESLLELLAYLYISVNPAHAIDILDFSYILAFINDGRVKADSLKDTHRAAISRLPVGSAQALAKRITRELKEGNMTAVGYCNAWRDQSFVREWINYVTTTVDSSVDLAQVLAAKSESTSF